MLLEFEGTNYQFATRSTIERDIRLSNLLRESGVQEAMLAALTAGEDVDARIFGALTQSGKIFDILGCALVPEGVDPIYWTPALARETAEKLKKIASDAAKQLLLESVVGLVKAFFLAGLHSLATSRRSSPESAKAQPAAESAGTLN